MNKSKELTTVDSYGYYSKVLNKPFDTLEELKAAELKVREEAAAKEKLSAEKKARAEEVEKAYLEYQKVKEEAYKKISEAENKWLELRDKFAEDYHGYHMTYSNVNGKKEISFGDLLDSFFHW